MWKEHTLGKKKQTLVYRRRVQGEWKKRLPKGNLIGRGNYVIEVAPVGHKKWAIYTYDHHRRRIENQWFNTPEAAMLFYDMVIQ